MRLGTVAEIWRYPVKSMGGERLGRVEVGTGGLPGDRAWAVRDEVRGGIRGAKKLPGLMRCKARYPDGPGPAPVPEIALPDGTRFAADAPDAAERVSRALEHAVTLWPRRPADDLDHYRRGAPTHDDPEREMRAMFALEPEEPIPDLSRFPRELLEYESPPGTYFDAFPLLLLTDASLRRLQALAPASKIDVRRFRPNFLIAAEPGAEGFVEASWPQRKLRVGGLEVRVVCDAVRCVMVTHGFDDLPKDPSIMRTLVREAGQNLGVYAEIARAGSVSAGDPVELLG